MASTLILLGSSGVMTVTSKLFEGAAHLADLEVAHPERELGVGGVELPGPGAVVGTGREISCHVTNQAQSAMPDIPDFGDLSALLLRVHHRDRHVERRRVEHPRPVRDQQHAPRAAAPARIAAS